MPTEDKTQDDVMPARRPRRMLNLEQVQEITSFSRTTIFRMEKAGTFPKSVYTSPNRRIWFEDTIIAWQDVVDQRNPNRRRGAVRQRI